MPREASHNNKAQSCPVCRGSRQRPQTQNMV